MSVNLKLCLTFVSAVVWASTNAAASDHTLEKDLRKSLENKIIALRTAYDSTEIHFGKDGNMIGSAALRPWLNGGVFNVQRVQLRNGLLKIEGDRVIFMHTTEKPVATSQKVNVVIDLDPAAVTKETVAKLLQTVFQTGQETSARLVDYWKQSPDPKGAKDRRPDVIEGGRPVYPVETDKVVVAPKPLFAPNPEYDEEARKRKVQGTVVFTVVVNEEGLPEMFDLRESRPGLDQNAIDTLSRWRFQPATRDGKPVCASLKIEVYFNLY